MKGLLAMGQGVSGAIESRRKADIEKKEREEKRKERQFTKTLSLVNLYTKMGDDLTPEARMKLYTGALLPMLAKVGGLPEGTNQDDVSQFIGTLAVHSKEAMQGFREDNDKLLDLVAKKKWKEADKFLSGMMIEYGKLPGAKSFLDHAKTLLKDEKAYGRGKEEKKKTREYEVEKTIANWLAKGEVEEVPKSGLLTGLEAKGTTFTYGGRQFISKKALEKPEKITEKDRAAARKRISQIEKDYANLKTKGVGESELSLLSSDAQILLGSLKGKKLSADDLDYVRKVYDKEIQALINAYGLKGYEKLKEKVPDWREFKR